MKKIALIALILLSGILVPAFVRAESDDTQSDDSAQKRGFFMMNREDRNDMMETRKELWKERAETMKENREEMREKVAEFRKEKAGIFVDRIKGKFEWAINWLQNIHDRMETRVAKIEDETDIDLTEAKGYLDDAQTHIDEALDALKAIVVDDSDDATDEDNKTKVDGVREKFAEAKTHIKEARESLRLAMQSIKKNMPRLDSGKPKDSE